MVLSKEIENSDLINKIENIDWQLIYQNLHVLGYAKIPAVLTPQECKTMLGLYDVGQFRSTISMAQYSFGSGVYKYFSYPLPNLVSQLRHTLYSKLVNLANDWNVKMGIPKKYPDTLRQYTDECHGAGQNRPTPLILRYGTDDYNCLHQDLYGEMQFPLQSIFALNQKGDCFEGGEIVLVEQRPRKQSRASVITLNAGEGLIFAVSARPVVSARGYSKVILRHGVSQIHSGQRYSLGVIFHDAK